MKLREKMKRFWTLDVHNHEGFTLVELIIVIAILAILSTGAIAGYSVYVERANKTADRAMIAEIKNVLTLAYYNGDLTENGLIVLSVENGPNYGESEQIEAALKAAYGENGISNLKLKYNDWGTFDESNFYSDDEGLGKLLNTVEGLTGALADFLNSSAMDAIDSKYSAYASAMGASTTAAMADAAVFYVADTTAKLDPAALQNAVNAITGANDHLTALNAMKPHLGGSSLASAAALYALAEGYATFFENSEYEAPEGQKTPREILDEVTKQMAEDADTYEDDGEAFGVLFSAFQEIQNVDKDAMFKYSFSNEGDTPLQQDLNAYADAMKTVSAAKNSIMSNNGKKLGDAGYFDNEYIFGILSAYADGSVLVSIVIEDNDVSITCAAIDEN